MGGSILGNVLCAASRALDKFFICFFRSIYPVNKVFFLVETIDRSKHYKPTNKIVIDVQAGVNLFHDRIGLVKHVVELTKDLCDKWNTKYYNQPQVNLKKVNLSLHLLCPSV